MTDTESYKSLHKTLSEKDSYTKCKSKHCHNIYKTFFTVDETLKDFDDNICIDCRLKIQKTIANEQFEETKTVIRRKELDFDDIPEWIVDSIENQLDAEQQTIRRYGQKYYNKFLTEDDGTTPETVSN